MWLLEQIASPAYNNSLTIKLSGKLEQTILEKSLNEIIKRHEILRTTFSFKKNLVQVVTSVSAFPLPMIDLSNVAEADKQEYALELLRQKTHQPFNLSQDVPFRVVLLKLSETEHWLHWALHHIVTDDASFSIILKELASLYKSFLENTSSPLPVLPFQYGDYAYWQQSQVENFEQQLTYWQKQLENLPLALNLPTDRQLSNTKSLAGRQYSFSLSPQLTKLLISFSQKAQVTLFSTLLTAFYVLLYRYTQQDDLIVAVPVSVRHRPEMQDLIGVFINTVLIRCQPRDEIYFQSLLQQVHKSVVDAREHQKLPYHKLIEVLRQNNNLDSSSLIQVAFDFQTTELPQIQLSNLTISPIEIDPHITTTDLTLHITNSSDSLSGYFSYSTDLFDVSTIERMKIHFQTLLEGIVENPQQKISQLPLLSKSEKHQLLIEWNNTATEYPKDKCIHKLFEEQVERNPDAIAITFNTKIITYSQLNNRANQLANYLRSKGVGSEDKIGIFLERSIEMIVGLLAILKVGGAYVTLDPNYPKERIEYMLKDSGISILITKSEFVDKLPAINTKIISLDKQEQIIASQAQSNPVNRTKPNNLAYIIYTSGSTGKPKGVAVTHLGINRLVNNTNYIQLQPSDRVAQSSNASFDAATFEIWGALLNGAQLVGIPQEIALSPEKFVTHLQEHQISVVFLTTALFNQFAALVPTAFKSLRYLLFGGEAVDPNSVKKILQHGKPQNLLHVYGPTENTTFSSWYLVEEVSEKAIGIPIGTPIANTQIYILDNYLQPVPIGIPGEIYIGGNGLAREYFNRPELTSEKFIQNPFSNCKSERLYKTGDLARYFTDGNIEFLGRIDNQVKIRGFRIELGEIESVLNTHPQVNQAVVIAREDIPGDKRLVAYVVKDELLTTKQLRAFIKEQLPEYMVPSAFITLDKLPLTTNGKVDKKALPVPDKSSIQLENKFVPPSNPIQEILATIWADVLGVEQVGIHDNFFELGGHSLLAIRLVAEIEKATQTKLPLAALFQFTTISELCSIITQDKVAYDANINLSTELLGLNEDDLRALLTVAAGRGGTRLRPDSLINAIRSEGEKPPLFYCANATKEISSVAQYLGEEQPVYLLESGWGVFLRKEQRTEDNIKAVAARHVRDILAINPTGPYLIAGYSFGKFVAYEVAKQLEQQGKKVAMLAILDTPGSGIIFNYVRKILLAIEMFIVAITQELFRGSLHSFAQQLNKLFSRVKDNLTPKHSKNIFKPSPSKILIEKQSNRKTGELSTQQSHPIAPNANSPVERNKPLYHMQGYRGKITLFVASIVRKRHFKILCWLFPLMGWEQHIVDKIQVRGNHHTMVYEPHARVLADKLKACIDKATQD